MGDISGSRFIGFVPSERGRMWKDVEGLFLLSLHTKYPDNEPVKWIV